MFNMNYSVIGNSNPKYLAAADILIGDMSDINYEFLYFNRPVILLANEWLIKNFPNLGIKTDLYNLENSIKRSINNPTEFEKERKYWFSEAVHLPDGKSSDRIINKIIENTNIDNPTFTFIHNDNSVIKNTLLPIYYEAIKKGLSAKLVKKANYKNHKRNYIYI